MKNRHGFAVAFGLGYILLLVVFFLSSGAGHDWGTGAMVACSMPAGLIAIGLYYLFPSSGLGVLFPILGLLQWIMIGYFIGRFLDKRKFKP
jgi:hypothetical protein